MTKKIATNTPIVVTPVDQHSIQVPVINPDAMQDNDYRVMLTLIRTVFEAGEGRQLFTTDVDGQALWDAYLGGIPHRYRGHYDCNNCKKFIMQYGGLVFIADDGKLVSAIWPMYNPGFFEKSTARMFKVLRNARVTGVFLSEVWDLGNPQTGEWSHLSATCHTNNMWGSETQTTYSRMAEKVEEFKMLKSALNKHGLVAARTAVKILRSEDLPRSEKASGPGEWFYALHTELATAPADIRENVIWKYVATAPAGFCHINSTMIGTLLEDIAEGLPYKTVKGNWAFKMDPIKYARPQAPAKAGNIATANKLFEKLQAKSSLDRRFAKLEELQALWWARVVRQEQNARVVPGPFSHLEPAPTRKTGNNTPTPSGRISWTKFARTVLPNAISIEVYTPYEKQSFCAVVTAVDDNSVPILQWDSMKNRNPFSTYQIYGGSTPQQWNLQPGWQKVNAVCLKPSMWTSNAEHHGMGMIFIIDGCREINSDGHGNAIFPADLRADFHEIRGTIENYSKGAKIKGKSLATACGIGKYAGQEWFLRVRVKSDVGVTEYILDRWE